MDELIIRHPGYPHNLLNHNFDIVYNRKVMPTLAELRNLFFLTAVMVFFCSGIKANSIEDLMPPFEARSIERVLASLEQLAAELEQNSSVQRAPPSAKALDSIAILWSVEEAISGIDQSILADSISLKRALLEAGYRDSPHIVEEWQAETERVLQAYDVLNKGLNPESMATAIAEFEQHRSGMTDKQLEEQQNRLLIDVELLRITARDLGAIETHQQQLSVLLKRLSTALGR
jgi:hypothetical protein